MYKFAINLNDAMLKHPMMEDLHAMVGKRMVLGEGTGTDL